MLRNPISNRRLALFYFSYAVGLVVPVIFGIVLYIKTEEATKRDLDARLQFTLERTAIAISSIFSEVENIMAQASTSDQVLDLARMEFTDNQDRLRKLNQLTFSSACTHPTATSEFMTNFFIILPRPGVVLSNRSIMPLDTFYRYLFSFADVGRQEFSESFMAKTYTYEFRTENVRFGNETDYRRVQLLFHSLPMADDSPMVLIFVLNEKTIQSELKTALYEEGSAVYASDNRGALIGAAYREGPRFRLEPGDVGGEANGRDNPIIGAHIDYLLKSPDGSVQLTAMVSRDVFKNKAAYIMRSTLFIVFFLLLVDACIIAVLSSWNARPLSRILQMLQNESTRRESDQSGSTPSSNRLGMEGALSYVDQQLGQVLDRTHDLEVELEKQLPVINGMGKLWSSVVEGIRSSQNTRAIEQGKKGVAMLIETAPVLYKLQPLRLFASEVLAQLISMLNIGSGASLQAVSGFVATFSGETFHVLAGSGRFLDAEDGSLRGILGEEGYGFILESSRQNGTRYSGKHLAICLEGLREERSIIYIEEGRYLNELEMDLVQLFSANVTSSYMNIVLYEELESRLAEKTILIQEIHHRVKNNLQVIQSLLNMSEADTETGAVGALKDTRQRIAAMALIHDRVYASRNDDLIDFSECVSDMAADIVQALPRNAPRPVVLATVNDFTIPLEKAVPCSLLIEELISFSLACARNTKSPVELALGRSKHGQYEISVKTETEEATILEDALPLRLIQALTLQLGGHFEYRQEGALTFSVQFPA